MDRERFDALTRWIVVLQSRRAALGTLLGAALLGQLPATVLSKRKGKGKNRTQKRGKRKRSRRDGPAAGQRRGPAKQNQAAGAEAVPGKCCASGNCTPGPGKNLAKCCYEDQDLTGQNFKGANLGNANFSRAILTNANFSAANLDKTCLVDADTTGAKFAGANTGPAIFCRTQTDSGENNSGCSKGTPCCPTCDDEHPCGSGDVCCNGRCIPGDCCENGERSTCGAGHICCDNTCVAGDCCATADCPTEVCQRRSCRDHLCVYTPVFGEPGPGCPDPRICCEDAQGEPVCCEAGVTICQTNGVCGCGRDEDCGSGAVCCNGQCQSGVCCRDQDCPQEICQVRDCQDHACVYTPVSGTPGPDCNTICCQDEQGNPVCCPDGTRACTTTGLCHRCTRNPDCAANEICCNGTCRAPEWTNQAVFGRLGAGLGQLDAPAAVAVTPDGQTVFVTDTINDRISVWTRSGSGWSNPTTFGAFGDGLNELDNPAGVAVTADGQTVYVADSGNDRISVWTRSGSGWSNPLTFGTLGQGPAQFFIPTDLVLAPDGQTLWVNDDLNNRISIWTKSGDTWSPLTTFGDVGPNALAAASGLAVAVDGHTAWVPDLSTPRSHVTVWTRSGNTWTQQTTFGRFGLGDDQFRNPAGAAVTADGQIVFVADRDNNRISIWTKSGDRWTHQTNVGGRCICPTGFSRPKGVAVSADGRTVWVADTDNNRVSVWSLGCPAA